MTAYLEKNFLKIKNGKVVNNSHLQIQQTNKGYSIFEKKNGKTFKRVVDYDECNQYGKRLKKLQTNKRISKTNKHTRKTNNRK
jgi:hypothetical protein